MTSRLDLARKNRGKDLALCDQLGLGLADELVVIEAEEEQADQRQHHHEGKHREHDQPERGPPSLAKAGAGSCLLLAAAELEADAVNGLDHAVAIQGGELGADVPDMAVDGAV